MSNGPLSKVMRAYFAAYENKDRAAIEAVVSDDFTFSSPRDDHIDRATYFERCWPNSEKTRAIRIEKLFEKGNEAFVLYELELESGAKFRNIEFFRGDGNKITEVEVYFGSVTGSVGEELS